ncbi:MAG TPA: hypothetical protein VM124_03820 [Candidatus Limnocylindrales bacterium]|nr:hypothetical protein [Candidatus Limnocylindrales bacterium]
MAATQTSTRFELPVYEPETKVVYTKPGLREAAKGPDETMVRRVRLGTTLSDMSLKEMLEVADNGFTAVASKCGAQVVPHSWGLYRVGAEDNRYDELHDSHPLLPPDHILVAEVDVIRSLSKATYGQALQINRARRAYEESTEGLVWRESQPPQFGNGLARGGNAVRLWLIDIEPIVWPNERFTNTSDIPTSGRPVIPLWL